MIDADLRRPTVHHIFGLDRQPGLTDYIAGTGELEQRPENTFVLDTTLTFDSLHTDGGWENVTNNIIDLMLGDFGIDDILKTPGLDNLHIVNAGQGLLNPAEILRSPRFKEFLHEVRGHYDIIIVDTPPVLPVADALEVAPEVDGLILVYEVGRIGRGILKRAKAQLENVNSSVLGVILNNVKPDVVPDFCRYRTDYYYGDEDRDEKSVPHSRWRELLHQPLRTFQNTIGKMRLAPEAKGKGSAINFFLLVGILLFAGFAWQSYPMVKSLLQSRADKKEVKAQNVAEKKPILPASPDTKKRTGSASSAVSTAAQIQKTRSIETSPQGKIIEQKEIKTDEPGAPHRQGQADFEPSGKVSEKQLTGEEAAVARTPVAEARVVAEKNAAEAQVSSTESSIEHFIEKWRRSWEDGNLPTYIACYHPEFETDDMDRKEWEGYKRDLFKRFPKRHVQITDVQIQDNGSGAVVTFKQRYQAAKHQDIGLKTLHLRHYQDSWTIFKENWRPLSGQG